MGERRSAFFDTGSGARVMVVDDDAMLRSLVRMRLKKHGFTIIEASDGAQALRMFESEMPDIILMDANMPGMDGFEATQRIKALERAQKTPILMVSGLEDDESVDKAFGAGASEYITKPICWPLLVHRLKNICDAMRAEARIIQTKMDAIKANQSKSEFLANMSHELRTPMHAILSFANMGLEKVNDSEPEKLFRYFTRIKESGNRLLRLLNDLLDLSKLEAGAKPMDCKLQPLRATLDEVIDELSGLFKKQNIRVDSSACDAESMAWFDHDQLILVFRNLLGNAVKFSEPGTVITVSMDHTPMISQTEQGGHSNGLRVTVSDQGIGIPEQELNSVFDKFAQSSTTKTGAGGTGLGLSITREIIQRHGGDIFAKNNVGGGASFVFKLPLSNPKSAAA